MSIEEKKQLIKPKHSRISIQKQCELIGLPCSSYYRVGLAGQETAENLEFMRLIDKEYTDHPFYGTRQILNVLRRKGYNLKVASDIWFYCIKSFHISYKYSTIAL